MDNTSAYEFTIPKNTAIGALYSQQFTLPSRVIKSLSVGIPSGHKGLAYLEIFIPTAQIVPSQGSSVRFVRGDGERLDYAPNIRNDGPPYTFTCRGYNLDILIDHTFIINVTTSEVK